MSGIADFGEGWLRSRDLQSKVCHSGSFWVQEPFMRGILNRDGIRRHDRDTHLRGNGDRADPTFHINMDTVTVMDSEDGGCETPT